jgi:LysR family transcriptional regulator, nod-box dependent transcriptional activator
MRFEKLDLNLLVALDALVTLRNISRAAEQLHLTQSALSASLARLREFFEDDLLVPVGRRMELTPRAEALREPVRDVLVRVRAVIATRPEFDAAASERVFTLLASDYSLETLIPPLVAKSASLGGLVGFRVLPLAMPPARALESGEADMLLIPEAFSSEEHPFEVLVEEELVCIVWEDSEIARKGLSVEAYRAAGHVVMQPAPSAQARAFESTVLEQAGIHRRVAVATYSFASMPSLVVQTEFVATLQRRLAERMAGRLPVAILPSPIELPPMPLVMQWHTYRSGDPAIAWLRTMLRAAAAPVN